MERGLAVDHSTIGRWVLRYAPELNKRIRREIRTPNRSWRVDETYVKAAGDWAYLGMVTVLLAQRTNFHARGPERGGRHDHMTVPSAV